MASLGIGFLGEPAIASLIEKLLGESVPHGVSLAVSFGSPTSSPRRCTSRSASRCPRSSPSPIAEVTVAAHGAAAASGSGWRFEPLIWALNTASNAMLRAIGTNPKAEFDEASSSEDLKLLIAQSQTGGKLDPGEAGMLSGVFHLHEQEARQVMTPIPAVVTVDVAESAEDALRRCVDSGHTPAGGHRGRQHRPHPRGHPQQLAGPEADERGPGASIEAQRQGRR